MVELIGFIAGLCTTFCAVPQIIKLAHTRNVNNLSVLAYFIMCTGILLWFIYGYLLGATALMLANTFSLVLNGTILVMKLAWSK